VRLRKSDSARISKYYRINDQVYHISLEVEIPGQRGNPCKFLYQNYASSDSISSKDYVVEETLL